MEQKDIDVYEILKDVPKGTEFYTSLCGNVELAYLESNKEAGEAIWTENKDGEYSFNKNGRWMKEGEVLLFPSKEMRDWSKFFKKGDVLVNEDGDAHVIFKGFDDDTYKTFKGNYYLLENEGSTVTFGEYEDNLQTSEFDKANKENAQEYIHKIEERLGGKLNLETLEIEKPVKLTFEIGKLYVFREEDEDGELAIIGKLIDKNESEDTLTFGEQYDIENEHFVTNETFYLNISLHKELREATELEAELFAKHRSIRLKEEKEAREQPDFKPFDKVLVRDGKEYEWFPALFVRDRGEGANYRYKVLPLRSGKSSEYSCCIPYEGNENLIFTDHDTEDLPF